MLRCLLRVEAFLGPRLSPDFVEFVNAGGLEPSPKDELNSFDLSQYKSTIRKDSIKAYLTSVFERTIALKERAASICALYYCEDSEGAGPRDMEKVLEIKEAIVKTLCMGLDSVGEQYKAFVLLALHATEPEFKHHLCQSIVQIRSKERSAWVREVLMYVHSKESVGGSVSACIDTVAVGLVEKLNAEMERILNIRPGNNRLEIAYDSEKGVITLRKGPTLMGTVVVCPSNTWCFMYSLQYNASHVKFYQCVLITTTELISNLEYRMKTDTEIEFGHPLRHPTDV